MNPYWGMLALAIAAEVFGTLSLRACVGFSKLAPLVGVAIGYGITLYLLGRILEHLPVGVVYACWGGGGTLGVCLISSIVFREHLCWQEWGGIVLVVCGISVLSIYSSHS